MSDTDLEHDQPKPSRFKQLFKRDKSNDDGPHASEETAAQTNVVSQHQDAPLKDDDALLQASDAVAEGLRKSRSGLMAKIGHVFKGNFDLDDELFDDLEEALISSDIGIEASLKLVEALRELIIKEKLVSAQEVRDGLVAVIAQSLSTAEQKWLVSKADSPDQSQLQKPYVILMVGVNGVGKTTTTAKIARHLQEQGQKVMLAAADTFRAAAVEQLQNWGERLDIPVIAQSHGADAAAVAHDAYTSALAKDIDVLMIDTAGRLHTQDDLMQQLHKVQRVIQKMNPNAPHEVMQILDAGTGQNAITQLDAFQKAVGVSSVCMTKLDGSAKGGMALAMTAKFNIPIRFIGVGESYSDLKRFDAHAFAQGLIPSLDELIND